MKRGRPRYADILTPREWEVLALVERGYTNEEIGRELGISATTAKFHVSEILTKLNLPNRREARAWHVRRMPAMLSLLKGGAWLASTAAIAAVLYFGVSALLFQDSRAGASQMGKVAYTVDGDVWVKQLPGGPETQLTNWGDVLGEPEWSASGEWLSVVRDVPNLNPTPSDPTAPISNWIIDADGKRERQVEGGYQILRWSPVKDEYLFTKNAGPDNFERALWIEHADGSNQRLLLTRNDTGGPLGVFGWTPSGEWVIVDVMVSPVPPHSPQARAMVRIRADGTNESEFYRVERSECWHQALVSGMAGNLPPSLPESCSPFAGPSMAGIVTETHIIGAIVSDGSQSPFPENPMQAIPLVPASGIISGGNIGYDSRVLVYSPASGLAAAVVGPDDLTLVNKRILVFQPTSEAITYLTEPGRAAAHPDWSPDGRTLFFAAADQSAGSDSTELLVSRRIWSAAADGSSRTQLTDDPRYRDEYPQVTADGTQVLFVRIDLESEEGIASLWMLELANGALTMVVDDFTQTLGTEWQRTLDWWQPK